MKKLFLICLIAFAVKSKAQSKEALFDKICKQIITYLAQGQINSINKYTRPDIGVYYIVRPGAMDAIRWEKKIDTNSFPHQSEAYIAINVNKTYADDDLLKQMRHTIFTQKNKFATFNCESEKWSEEGIFTDIKKKTNRLTQVINIRKLYDAEYKKFAKQKEVKKIEATARKIIITKYNIAIYLFYDNNKWWIGIIDVTESDCSA